MHMLAKIAAAASLLCVGLTQASAHDGAEGDPLHAKADELHAYEAGTWQSRWERVDDAGNVTDVSTGVEIFSPTLNGTALELVTRIDGEEDWSRAIKFYNRKERKIVFIDVSSRGEYYVMKQDVETGTVVGRSQRPGAEDSLFRFVTVRKTDDEMDVKMEFSEDGGQTWRHIRNQYMRRIGGQ